MNISKCICTNIIYLLGIFILLVTLCYAFLSFLVYPEYLLSGPTFFILVLCYKTYIYILPSLFILGIIEFKIANKIFHKNHFVNIQITNKYIRYTYNTLFWLGITSSIFYISIYIWILSRYKICIIFYMQSFNNCSFKVNQILYC